MLKKINKLLAIAFFLLATSTILKSTPFYNSLFLNIISTIAHYSAIVVVFSTWIYTEMLLNQEVKK